VGEAGERLPFGAEAACHNVRQEAGLDDLDGGLVGEIAGVARAAIDLLFDFQQEYDISTLHFWNYNSEGFDVDQVDFTFFNGASELVGSLSIAPALSSSPAIRAQERALRYDLPDRHEPPGRLPEHRLHGRGVDAGSGRGAGTCDLGDADPGLRAGGGGSAAPRPGRAAIGA
jgi:hypothetical protein